jgi:hypothetical protein
MLAWYLLKDGQTDEGEALFETLRTERPGDAMLLLTLGAARRDAGLDDAALAAHDEALATAIASDPEMIDRARVERRDCRQELGLEPDVDDLLARAPVARSADDVAVAIAWFPRDQHARARARWPELGEDLHDPDTYCKRIEAELRNTRELTGRNPAVAPLVVEELESFAADHAFDSDSGRARSSYAARLLADGEAVAWPPGRNEPCWCGSGKKYKRCCGLR